jgi:hypothetical protein
MHALTAWDLKFQVCLGYTFTPATLSPASAWQWHNNQYCSFYVHKLMTVNALICGKLIIFDEMLVIAYLLPKQTLYT